MVESIVSTDDILDFWLNRTAPEQWFATDPTLDANIRRRFEPAWRAARSGALDSWAETLEGALALLILLHQFPRNMFRGRAEAFATDGKAREIAKHAIAKGFDRLAPANARAFFYLPLMHSEVLADQDACVRLIRENLGEGSQNYPFALRHRETIARFGRFPARNAALGRTATGDEEDFLARNPAGF
jgi:uncharacterized protein (DUF924 family)